jgi:hypothetical protein
MSEETAANVLVEGYVLKVVGQQFAFAPPFSPTAERAL